MSADDEVQCHFCGEFHCCECDLEHSCASTNTCTKCNKRFANADLALPTCECDEELCKPCLKAHLCPPTVSQGVNALSDDLAWCGKWPRAPMVGPGSKWGPCKSCEHTDCAESRAMAAAPCSRCGRPIGYDTQFFSGPTHRACELAAVEAERKVRS